MRAAILPLTLILVSAAVVGPAWAQRSERAGRGGRFGAKPGEIITPPDRSQRWTDRLRVGDVVPEFTLPVASGTGEAVAIAERGKRAPRRKKNAKKATEDQKNVSLNELRAHKPVVLIFGSVTCPPFRSQLDGIDNVYRDFRDRAEFLFVYIREAHPDSLLALVDENLAPSLVKIPQAATAQERTASASACGRALELSMPIAVDTIDNRVGRAYASWPNRMVVVGTDGRILFASPASPRGTDAARLRAWLEENLPQEVSRKGAKAQSQKNPSRWSVHPFILHRSSAPNGLPLRLRVRFFCNFLSSTQLQRMLASASAIDCWRAAHL